MRYEYYFRINVIFWEYERSPINQIWFLSMGTNFEKKNSIKFTWKLSQPQKQYQIFQTALMNKSGKRQRNEIMISISISKPVHDISLIQETEDKTNNNSKTEIETILVPFTVECHCICCSVCLGGIINAEVVNYSLVIICSEEPQLNKIGLAGQTFESVCNGNIELKWWRDRIYVRWTF